MLSIIFFNPTIPGRNGTCTGRQVMDDIGNVSMESVAEMIGSVLLMAIVLNVFKNLYTFLFKAALGAVKGWFCSQPVIGFLLDGWCTS